MFQRFMREPISCLITSFTASSVVITILWNMNRLCRVRILYSGEKRTFVMLCSSSLAVDCWNSTIYQQVLSSKHTLQVDNLNYRNPFRNWVSEVAVHYFSVCTMREGGRSRTVFLYLVYSSWLTYFVHLLDTTYGIKMHYFAVCTI